jgi:hypothetical protein
MSTVPTTSTTTPKPKVIRAKLGLGHQTAQKVLNASLKVYNNVYSSSFFTGSGVPAPPVDQATVKAANDTLQATIAAAAGGGKQALAAVNHAKAAVIAILEQLATYVSVNSKGDENAFISSGFTPKSTARTKTPPVSERIKKMAPGSNSGEMDVTLMKFPGAVAYELRSGTPGPGGVLPTTWTTVTVTAVRSPVTVPNLTPGATYVFQARALLKGGGYSDYGDPIARIAV